jgi:hypothetical protein
MDRRYLKVTLSIGDSDGVYGSTFADCKFSIALPAEMLDIMQTIEDSAHAIVATYLAGQKDKGMRLLAPVYDGNATEVDA